MTPDFSARVAQLIGPDTKAASDEVVLRVAEAVREVREHEHSADDIYCANLKLYLGERAAVLVARLLRAWTHIRSQQLLLAEAAEHITACPHPGEGYDVCEHGHAWPCRQTTLAWKLRNLDPKAETARILRAVYAPLIDQAEAEACLPESDD